MKLIFLSLLAFIAVNCKAQEFERKEQEGINTFVTRISGLEELPQPAIETIEWDKNHPFIIYFVPSRTGEEHDIIGYLLVPIRNLMYHLILIDTFYEEGATANIESVFFANADKDKRRELVILTSWPQVHRGAGIYGTLYGTYIYAVPKTLRSISRLPFHKAISEKLDGGFDGDRDRETVKARYKTAMAIRAALKKMGY